MSMLVRKATIARKGRRSRSASLKSRPLLNLKRVSSTRSDCTPASLSLEDSTMAFRNTRRCSSLRIQPTSVTIKEEEPVTILEHSYWSVKGIALKKTLTLCNF
ncbi:hypothetical protein LOTGIDRAFT_153477 [Lottia gigantea]|uniref:Uncharacterized protein n=1 Tax=Lottia gigantea TaxID=225164 RepID=V4AFT6_LOTGI|nr:hypothetical protein LOTGIDRAFT_153477 [Lottia gigantea]ESO94000.1 hypothetical protein LOTGIDRAFT_153477 [Lottia gigantea]